MKHLVNKILKEEYDNLFEKDYQKFKNFLFRKLESGKWEWIEKLNNYYLVDEKRIPLVQLENLEDLNLYDKFKSFFQDYIGVDWEDLKYIIEKFMDDEFELVGLNIKPKKFQSNYPID